MIKINYKILKGPHKPYINKIVDFYKPKYKTTFNYITVTNSTIICLALVDDKIIGSVRAISDLSRHGIIVDLMVDENSRKLGVGTKLMNLIINELLKFKVANISLNTEPNSPWLVDFYKKNNFKPFPECIHMVYDVNK